MQKLVAFFVLLINSMYCASEEGVHQKNVHGLTHREETSKVKNSDDLLNAVVKAVGSKDLTEALKNAGFVTEKELKERETRLKTFKEKAKLKRTEDKERVEVNSQF